MMINKGALDFVFFSGVVLTALLVGLGVSAWVVGAIGAAGLLRGVWIDARETKRED